MEDYLKKIATVISDKFCIIIKERRTQLLKEAIERRTVAKNFHNPEDYVQWILEDHSNQEWKILVDFLTVNETYFFRNVDQFVFLRDKVIPEVLSKHTAFKWNGKGFEKPKIRVLSAGCSTGEEPYSIGICFAENIKYLSGWDIRIDAIDISKSAIDNARKGKYQETERLVASIADMDKKYFQKYFIKKGNHYSVREKIKKLVRFQHGNIKDYFDLSPSVVLKYDIVFCRNLIIYFNQKFQKKLVEFLERSLKEEGYLLMGDAETLHLYDHNLKSLHVKSELIYKKQSGEKEDTQMSENKSLKLEDHEFELLRNFITEHFGIYFSDKKRWLLESKLNRLLHSKGFDSFFDYYNHLMQRFYINQEFTDQDFIDLISSISNNETFFGREIGAFKVLRNSVFPELFSQKSNIRILSAGCSTGAEPYTLAISILRSGKILLSSEPMIIAADIDPNALKIAKKGEYKESYFRGCDKDFQKHFLSRYFITRQNKNKTLFKIKESVKTLVEYKQLNILDLEKLKELGMFDIVFCRNVIIYFSNQGKKRAIKNFGEIIRPNGYLFLGHSESIIGKSNIFTPIEEYHQIYYQKV